MITPKSLTTVAALLAGGSSLAIAQNGLPTGGAPPVAGGANGNPVAPGFDQAPNAYTGYAPAYIVEPGHVASGPAPAPGPVHRHGSMYMYVPPHRSTHAHKITPNGGY